MPVVDLTAQRTGKQGKITDIAGACCRPDCTKNWEASDDNTDNFQRFEPQGSALQICIIIITWQVPVAGLTAQRTGKQVKREKRRGIREEKR